MRFFQKGNKKKLIKIIFVDGVDPDGIVNLAKGLHEFNHITDNWDGNLDSAYPLIIVFSKKVADFDFLDEYHLFGWEILQLLSDYVLKILLMLLPVWFKAWE